MFKHPSLSLHLKVSKFLRQVPFYPPLPLSLRILSFPRLLIMAFKPALLVMDMQNDYCSPEGGLHVSGNGMDLVAPIRELLSMKGFAMRMTAMSEIPRHHKALARNHKGGKPHEHTMKLPNPKKGRGHEN